MLVIYCCLERENDNVLKYHVNSFCCCEIKVSLFKRHHPISVARQNFKIK